MNYALHLATYGTEQRKLVYGRLFNWIENDVVLPEDEVDVLLHSDPVEHVAAVVYVLLEAIHVCPEHSLRVHCYAEDLPIVQEAIAKLGSYGVSFDVVSGTDTTNGLTAQCMLMKQMAQQEYKHYNSIK